MHILVQVMVRNDHPGNSASALKYKCNSGGKQIFVNKNVGTYLQVHAQVENHCPNCIATYIPEFANTYLNNFKETVLRFKQAFAWR